MSYKQISKHKGKSAKGYFYLGISLYKKKSYSNAVMSYQKSVEIYPKDSQLHYNLGLAFFKQELYTQAVEHLKLCTSLDPLNGYAYNNLAFIYNMHQYYNETIKVCNTAKLMLVEFERNRVAPSESDRVSKHQSIKSMSQKDTEDDNVNHHCHRHWAFAYYKKGEMVKAVKLIKKAVQIEPKEPDNWIVWGLVMRTVGSYQSAKHKFTIALKLDPENETAKYEMELLTKIIELDSQISLE